MKNGRKKHMKEMKQKDTARKRDKPETKEELKEPRKETKKQRKDDER